eukprot:TRINITY_DN8632_c0_g1_i1.p1 TRINITY_DN8632_c0_g1~~TRINITY_DN8632_c0_g1_i1.p1  ORF type:complete len:927 (-),score=121.46 TRINITY_DN8632_c0_g1_i1:74-2854(-)
MVRRSCLHAGLQFEHRRQVRSLRLGRPPSMWFLASLAFLSGAAAVTYCQGGGEFNIGYGDCSSYANTNFDYCSTDYDDSTGLYARDVCSECSYCTQVVVTKNSSCSDASSRRRWGASCSYLYKYGYCTYGGRRRTYGGEASDYCQATCGKCSPMTGPAASCPHWVIGAYGQSCDEACSAISETCLEGYDPTSFADMRTVYVQAGVVCPYVYSSNFTQAPCRFDGSDCHFSPYSATYCNTKSAFAQDARFCCCSGGGQPEPSTTTPVGLASTTTSSSTAATTTATMVGSQPAPSTTTTPVDLASTTTSSSTAATTTATMVGSQPASSTTTTPVDLASTTTSSSTAATTTVAATSTSTILLHPAGTINCSALEDIYTDCAVRIRDRFPFDYCAVPSDRAGCEMSCCGKEADRTKDDGACGNLTDFWWDCTTRIQAHWKDCKDYCLASQQQGVSHGCDKSCCTGAGGTGYKTGSSLPFLSTPNCSDPSLQDIWQDCATRIKDNELDGKDYCAIEFQRRGCEKACCGRTPPATVSGCEGLVDHWHDCEVRIWDRYKDGNDYCASADSRCGCQLSCCAKSSNSSVLSTGTNCSDTNITDLRGDCKVRIANVALTGQDLCANTLSRRSCEKSCCEYVAPTKSSCNITGISDFWPNCDVRIADRKAVGQDYCLVEFDRKGCEKSCCEQSSSTNNSCDLVPADTAADCATRISDRAEDGLDYCYLQSDRAVCEKSCCLGLGLPVTFEVTVTGINPSGITSNSNLSTMITASVAQTVADEAGVPRVRVNVTVGSMKESDRRLATAAVSTDIAVSVDPSGMPPSDIVSAIDPGLTGAIAESIQRVPGIEAVQEGAVAVTEMTSPTTPTLAAPTTTSTTKSATPAASSLSTSGASTENASVGRDDVGVSAVAPRHSWLVFRGAFLLGAASIPMGFGF